jgi:hypothetical protein
MTAATLTRPATLRETVLDALHDAYWWQRGEIDDCPVCRKSPAGVCADPDHQEANARALAYEDARNQIERTPGNPEVLAVLPEAGERS